MLCAIKIPGLAELPISLGRGRKCNAQPSSARSMDGEDTLVFCRGSGERSVIGNVDSTVLGMYEVLLLRIGYGPQGNQSQIWDRDPP